jgi:ankyrin repeat protein
LVTNSGDTALSIATRNGHAAIIQLLTAATTP